jgi:hypothetical protein
MAGAPPSRTPVLNLGRGNEQPDDEPSFARFLQLPPELRVMTYEYYIDSLGTYIAPRSPRGFTTFLCTQHFRRDVEHVDPPERPRPDYKSRPVDGRHAAQRE